MLLPLRIRGSYTIRTEFSVSSTSSAGGGVGIILPFGPAHQLVLRTKQVYSTQILTPDRIRMYVDSGYDSYFPTTLSYLDNKLYLPSMTKIDHVIKAGERYQLDIRVQSSGAMASVTSTLNGIPLISWKGRVSSVGMRAATTQTARSRRYNEIRVDKPDAMGVQINSYTTLHGITLRLDSGSVVSETP